MSVQPHGGKLINRYADPSRVDELTQRCSRIKSWFLTERELADLEMIASGALSPLTGFMNRSDFKAVLDTGRLSKGLPWTLPVTLAVSQSFGASLRSGEEVALLDASRKPIAIMTVTDVFDYNPLEYAHKVFRTTDDKHPGVAPIFAMGPKLVAGDVVMLRRREHRQFTHYRLDPAETREQFENMGWRTVAGFQTPQIVNRAQEYIQKCALETVDGLLMHAFAEERTGEVPADIRMRCCETLIDNYYPKKRVLLAVHPGSIRQAGGREAVFQALVAKNYGCTHFIVYRDPASPFESQDMFGQYDSKDLGITTLFFDPAFFCKGCGGMATSKTCPHTDVARVLFTDAGVRDLLQKGKPLPLEYVRAEIGVVLLDAVKSKKSANLDI